ncbi:MAG: dienelactone hydrolase family protein [Xanthobacteraceae bacterium]
MRAIGAALALLLTVACSQICAQEAAKFGPTPTLVVIPETYKGVEIQLRTWVQTPSGAGPFNTVMLVPGCNGLDTNGWEQMQTWAAWLMRLNYAVMMIDSFTPRNVTNTCGNGETVQGQLHAADLYTAATYISRLPQFRGRKIGAMGFSHGGWGILEAASDRISGIDELRARLAKEHIGIAAFVAVYPACYRHIRSSFAVPLLIIIGENDDWTPAWPCRQLAAYPRLPGPELYLKIYPRAFHVFDVDKPPRRYVGHELEYNAEATANARREIQDFFGRLLQ